MISQTEVGYSKGQSHGSSYARGVKVYLGGLDPIWSEQDIYCFMSPYGNILKISIAKNDRQYPKGYGFVYFSNSAEAESSFGSIQYKHRSVVVKPSQKNNHQGYNCQKSPGDYQDPQSKQTNNILNTLDHTTQAGSVISHSSMADIRKSPALSKYSKNFDTHASLNSKLSTELDEVSVKVIKVSEEISPKEKCQTANQFSPISSLNQSCKPSEKAANISKFSKEFHPKGLQISSTNSADMEREVETPAAMMALYQQEEGNKYYSRMTGSVQADFIDLAAVRTKSAGIERQFAPESTVRIKFYTFPGRE